MKPPSHALLLAAACAALSGCVFEAELGYKDHGPIPPSPPYCHATDGGRDALPCAVAGACAGETWVMDKVLFPTSAEESMRFALDYKGKKYNSMGSILALVSVQLPGLDMPTWMARELTSGQAINLLRLRRAGGDLGSGGAVVEGQVALAKPEKCCPDADKWPECADEAKKTCFSGSHSFSLDQAGAWMPGSLKGGQLSLGQGGIVLALGIKGTGLIRVPAVAGSVRGKISGDRIEDGVMSGALSRQVMQGQVIPWLAAGINDSYTDPKTAQSDKDLLKSLFDTNKDGQISADELRNNGLIKSFLDGDVDANCDGVKELSVGLGFTAVRASIKP